MHNGIWPFKTIDIWNCSKLRFSKGGQWFAAADNKNLYLYNSYTLQRISVEKLTTSNVADLQFNDNDTCLAIIYTDGYVVRYMTKGGFTKTSESGYIDKQQSFTSCSFPNDENDEIKIVVMGSDGTKGNIKVINHKEEVV